MDSAAQFRRICLAQIEAGNLAWVTDLRDKALALITKGKGQLTFLNSASLNGKNFGRSLTLSNLSVADITQSAINEADTGATGGEGSTVCDFSR